MPQSPFYDQAETRGRDEREAALLAALPAQIARAKSTRAFAETLRGIAPADIADRAALARLPVLRKSDLLARQRADLPFAGAIAVATAELARVFHSPGPMYVPQPARVDFARMARALFASGLRAGDLVHVSFAFHFTPGGWMMDGGARALGCPVFPAGTGNTELQAQTIAELRPRGYAGTPSFLKIILEKGKEMAFDHSSLACALVSGEAFAPSLQQAIKELGVDAYQCYATADTGLIAYESPAREGMVLDEELIVEIVRPGTGDPVSEGEVGEVVVTSLAPEYPLIRLGTGDMSAILSGPSPCGRTNARIKGWMGRADQTTKVKGMFVHPHQVAEVLRRHDGIVRGRLVVGQVDGADVMTLRCETFGAGAALVDGLRTSIHAVCKLKGEVELVAPGTLPNDGKVIEDTRTYR
ncbi:MAG: phenylacetate--CoA ligase family protein [Alphaproteobacteria bacterium]